jgi:hypothetical protein
MTATTPEIVTTDVETFNAGRATAVLQRHHLAAGEVRFDVWANVVGTDSCGDPEALLDASAVLRRAAHALKKATSEL